MAQYVCKSIHEGPRTGWLPSDIKTSWHRTFWDKLEGLKAFPKYSEVTSAEWLIQESGYTLLRVENAQKSVMGTRCVYNCTGVMVDMGLDNIVHNDGGPHHASIFNALIKDWVSDNLRKLYQYNEQRLFHKYNNIRFLDDEDNQTYMIAWENL